VEGANEGVNTLFDTVDILFGTVDRKGVGNNEGANLLLLAVVSLKHLKTTPSVYFSKAYELVLQRPKQPGVLCQHLTALGSYATLPICIHVGPIQSRWLSYVAYRWTA